MQAPISIEKIETTFNLQVARRIMGWESESGPYQDQGDYYTFRRPTADGGYEFTNLLPNYVAEMDAAMTVAQEIHRRIDANEIVPGLPAGYLTLVYAGGEMGWFASFNLHLSRMNSEARSPYLLPGWAKQWWTLDFTFNDDNPAFCICRAAMEMIEAQEARAH